MAVDIIPISMSSYEYLKTAGQPERQAVAEHLINSVRDTGTNANTAYLRLCEQVIANQQAHETTADESLPRWEFPAHNSALLVRSVPRVRGFLNAIARAPQARSVIDAGCGSSALLSIGAAVTHPRAEITAYEINDPAARCARAMIDLLGYSDRINVNVADVITADLPEADLAVTETFAAGLLTEMGTRITTALARTANEILPAYSELYACDLPVSDHTAWQPAARINFADENDIIGGRFTSTGAGQRPINVYAAYFDSRSEPVLAEVGSNNLTNPVYLGSVAVPYAGAPIGFSYAACAELHENPATIWVGA